MATGPRSARWRAVRAAHLDRFPACAACGHGLQRELNVHHIKPFHLFPELELVDDNLITLCERPSFSCHWVFGHGGHSWSDYNPAVRETARGVMSIWPGIIRATSVQ